MQQKSKSAIRWLIIAAMLFLIIRFSVRPHITVLFGTAVSSISYQLIWAILATIGIWLCSIIYRNNKLSKELRRSCDNLSDSLMRHEQEVQKELRELKASVANLTFESLKKEGKFRFTKDMPLTEALAVHPDVAKVLFTRGLACVSCPSAAVETIEQAAQVHGMDVQPLLDDLNKLLES